jgi:hypothetical protein
MREKPGWHHRKIENHIGEKKGREDALKPLGILLSLPKDSAVASNQMEAAGHLCKVLRN